VTPAGYVLPGGLRGGEADVVAGLFRQDVRRDRQRRPGQPRRRRRARQQGDRRARAVRALRGRSRLRLGPADAIGVFQLAQAELVGAKNGALVFQIDFTLNDQLRIST
jgi:hypothetical protein